MWSAAHDPCGFHPSHCRSGNRDSLYTVRHDSLQTVLIWCFRRVGLAARAVGRTRLFGTAGWTADMGYLYADIQVPNYRTPGRSLYIDVAVTCPARRSALNARPSAADMACVAARMRSDEKHRHYDAAVRAVGGEFRAGVVERFGACSDDMLAILRIIAGDADRDLMDADDWYFTAPSQRSYYSQHVVFSAVIADAQMVDSAAGLDGVDEGARLRDGRRAG